MIDIRSERVAVLKGARGVRARCHAPEPAAGSPAAHELETAAAQLGTDLPVRRVIWVADLWTVIAVDQLYGIGVLYAAGDSVFSVFPIVRSIIEHSAACTWVLDPTVATAERAARAAVYHLESATALLPAASHMGGGKGTKEFKSAKAALVKLRAEIQEQFPQDTTIQPIRVNGVTRASPTAIVSGLGTTDAGKDQWSGIYDYLCCTATHPNLTVSEFFDIAGDGRVSLEMSEVFAGKLLRAACAAFNEALRHLVSYCGWPAEAIEEFADGIERVFPS